MRSRKIQLSASALVIGCLCAQTPVLAEGTGAERIAASRSEFRVCADPNNLPFTDRQGQGFENKIVELLARSAGQPLVYYWRPQRRGFVKNTLDAWECDIVGGIPTHADVVRTTQPYYCSRYVMVHRPEQNVAKSLISNPDAKSLRIGVVEHTPPLDLLLQNNLHPVVYFTNYDDRDNVPGQIVADVATGKIDVALVWGPVGGFFVRDHALPLRITMLDEDAGGPRLTFPISFGVRRADTDRSAFIDNLISRNAAEIGAILSQNGIPTVDDPVHCPTLIRDSGLTPISVAQSVNQVAGADRSDHTGSAAAKTMAEQVAQASQAQAATQAGTPASDSIHCNGTETMDDIQKLAGGSTGTASASEPPYTVRDGKVDAKTYSGWIRFSAFCQQCHGMGGVGSEIAPDLTQAVKNLNKHQFDKIVSCGLKGNLGTGVMPAWGDNPNIRPYLDNLWAYLRARANGALGAGRPQKLSATN